jgi:hypothetical protein
VTIKSRDRVKEFLKGLFSLLGWKRKQVERLRELSTWGIAIGFTAAFSAVFYPRLPSMALDFILGDYSGILESLAVSDPFFSFLAGFSLLSLSAIVHLSLDIYLESFGAISEVSAKRKLQFLVLASFFLSFVTARTLVILSGIVGPEKSSGLAGFIPVNEIWFQGYHIHHFFFGFGMLVLAGWMLLFTDRSRNLAAVIYGSGTGIFVDEIGMLLTEGDYFAGSSYVVAVTFATLLLTGVYWNRLTFREDRNIRDLAAGILSRFREALSRG